MSDRQHLQQIRSFISDVLERDGHDLEAVKKSFEPVVEVVSESPEKAESATLEAIISVHRPVFAIANDKVDPTVPSSQLDDQVAAMVQLVKDRANTINGIIPAIGRIDLPDDENNPWVGTGWIIDSELGSDIVVTNAHVAQLFAERSGTGFVFSTLPFLNRKETPIIDFRRELAQTPARRFKITDVIYIGTPGFLDIAFLRVTTTGDGQLSGPIKLAQTDPAPNLAVATIGYPGTDRGTYDLDTLLRVFGNVFDTKRLAPGRVIGPDDRGISHDCSTMPGSSGSILFNTETGEAVGLHFQGVPFKSNHAVPVSVIRKLIKERPWQSSRATNGAETRSNVTPVPTRKIIGMTESSVQVTANAGGGGIRVVIPLEVTVRLGTSVPSSSQSGDGVSGSGARKTDWESAKAAAAVVKQQLQTNKDVVGVRATYLFKDGQLTDEVGVVIKVRPEASRDAKDYGLASAIGGVAIVIEMADLESLARALAPEALEAPAQMQAYKRDLSDPRFRLDPITDDMDVTLHVSPEAGWRELSKFFDGDDYEQITIGMYNFTAPHIIGKVRSEIKPRNRQMTMTIDRKSDDITGSPTKKNDWHEEKLLKTLTRDAVNRFKWTPASVSGPGRLFATSYHIKVAVLSARQGRTGQRNKRFWLSSGNWASSNQAPLDDAEHPLADLTWDDVKAYDRDWHAIVANERLATIFRNHLEQDFEDSEALAGQEAAAPALPDLLVPEDYFLEAPRTIRNYKPFAPKVLSGRITIHPVLTPDNYSDIVEPLISGANESVLFINQSFDIKEDEDAIPQHYRVLLDALLDRQKKGKDVRIIFRSGFGKERDIFRRAVEFGFDKKRIRFFGTCHTKGIVADKKRVLLGSQNWTGAGTKPNRDASLLIESEEAANYFAQIFEFDWANVATDRVAPDHGPTRRARAVSGDEESVIPAGFRVVPWNSWEGT